MGEPISYVGMTPCHPGELIRAEILAEPGLPIARGGGSRRAPRDPVQSGQW